MPLGQLEKLVLYGIGLATSIAYSLFINDRDETITSEPLLPNLSDFTMAVTQMSSNDDLSHFLASRSRYQLPRLQKLSINSAYLRHMSDMNRMDILEQSSNDIFVIADPEVGKFIPIEEVNLHDFQTI